MIKRIGILFLIVIMIFLVGCVGNGDETIGENNVKVDTLDTIKERGIMTFAMTGAYPPFNYIDTNGSLIGFDIDIANAIAQKLGVEAEPVTVLWDGIIGGLTSRRFDMIIGSMAITEERLEKVNFTDPYYFDGAQFFGRNDLEANDISEIEDAVVGVVTGTTFQNFLENMENIKDIMQFESDVDNMRAVQQNRTHGLVTGLLVGLNGIDKFNIPLEPIGEPLYSEACAIAIRKDDPMLLEAVNNALQEMKDDGTYAQISEKWFGVNILEN